MADDGKLRDIESAWLLSIDALLMQNTPNAHAVAAARIVDHWSSGGPAFRRELTQRAKAWRKRQDQMVALLSDKGGVCQRLIRTMDAPPPEQDASEQPSVRSRIPIVRPSHRPHNSPRRITDAEKTRFMKLIDAEGISVVFDPGMRVTADDKVFRPPLIVLDGVRVSYDQIAPAYEGQEIARPWSPHDMEPRIALAFD